MNIEIFNFILYFLTFVFFSLSFVFLIKYKRFQDKRILDGVNVYLFGFIFLIFYIFILFLQNGEFLVKRFFLNYYNVYNSYVNYLVLAGNLVFLLAIGVCYLISVILIRESLEEKT